MIKKVELDLSRLVGFEQLDMRSELDFQGDAVGATLGAKRGAIEPMAGIETAAPRSQAVDFSDDAVGATLGAKRGVGETDADH